MTDSKEDVFTAVKAPAKDKAAITDRTARAIIKDETDQRAALTRKLREARLAREAAAPAPAPEKKPVRRSPKFAGRR